MSTTEILLVAILVAITSLLAVSIMNLLSNHMWQTKSRLEKLKKHSTSVEDLKEQYRLVNSWKGHLTFFGNAILYGAIISAGLYLILSFFLS